MAKTESAAAAMRTAARRFLDGLDDDQRATATVADLDDDERLDWHYVPRERNGLSLAAMDADQAVAAYALLSTGLRLPAYAAATAVVALEDVLDRIEGGHRHRHRRDYSLTVFGDVDDDATAPWGWRFEGHHVSLNVTLADGRITGTPLFLGANPAEVLGPTGHPVARPLAAEEELARALHDTLTDGQRAAAHLGDVAPDDILTTAEHDLTKEGVLPDHAGVRLADLTGAAERATDLVRLYLDRLPPDVSEPWWATLRADWGDVRFAVAGDLAHRRPQYYRLTAPHLLVEYDNTQNEANHVHTVLRDPTGDFGRDLLRRHRAEHHHPPTPSGEPMRFAIKTSPQETRWADMLAVWKAADEIETFESGWTFDHFYPIFSDPTGPCLEGWVTLTALAQATTRLRVGVLVTGIHYRHPAVLANMAATLDIVSNGRLELGIGAGWNEEESGAYGIELGSLKERFDRFDEACEVITGLLTQETTNFRGRYFTLTDARCEPKPVQQPHPPICIGGSGEKRTLRSVARFADHWNWQGGTVDQWKAKLDVLHSHCADVGRDPSEILTSTHLRLPKDGDVSAVVQQAEAFAEAGLDLGIVYLPTPHTPAVLEPLAEALEPLR